MTQWIFLVMRSLRALDIACANADELAATIVEQVFGRHPDAAIISSFPGLGHLTGARVLAEIGDDRARFTSPRAVKAYAGSAPVTRNLRQSASLMHRWVKNRRLASAGYHWAFSALTASPGTHAHPVGAETASVQVRAHAAGNQAAGVVVLVVQLRAALWEVAGAAWRSVVLLRLAYLTVTSTFAVLRLLPMSDRDKDTKILALRHQLAVLERQLGEKKVRFT
ncbi:transposase [Actinomadura sp. 9N407]|uniref:transposase n=1 Tax=Actinomadura sp. 9N407 TaxID=3375154 RepID=UPI0037A88B1B